MSLSQKQITDLVFADVTAAEAAGRPGEICYVQSLKTVYDYVVAGSAYTVDHTYVLSTGNAGNTRWVARAGQYAPLKLLGADTDILTLGDATHEGGDLKIYRTATGDLQFSLDADAASNAIALSVYGGVVAQNFLTIGQAALNTAYPLYINGTAYVAGTLSILYDARVGEGRGLKASADNAASVLAGDITVSGTDSTTHTIKTRIDASDIIVAQATGNGAGGITNKAIGLYGTTPAVQAGAIGDPAESTAGNNAAIDSILAALRGIGLIAT